MRLRVYGRVWFVLLIAVLSAACQTHSPRRYTTNRIAVIQPQRIAVMPFIKGLSDSRLNKPIKPPLYCPVADLCFNVSDIQNNADERMTEYLQDALQQRYPGALIPLPTVRQTYAALPKNAATDTPLSLAVALGRKLGADHVMVGTVWRYQELVGSGKAASRPASVAFSLYLLRVQSNEPVWEATFDKTQKPLSENLLNIKAFFKMGARWLTADELARYGINKVLETAP